MIAGAEEQPVFNAALQALKSGLSVIPIDTATKRPLLSWATYQEHRAAAVQVNTWWTRWPNAGLGVVTGVVSGIIVVDVDSPKAESLEEAIGVFGQTPLVARTRSGGAHCYYRHPGLEGIPNAVRLSGFRCPIDLRGDGGYVVAPPTPGYSWMSSGKLADLPLFEPAKITTSPAKKRPDGEWDELAAGAGAGERNQTLASVVGKVLRDGVPERWARLAAYGFGSRCRPPMDPSEVEATFAAIARLEESRRARRAEDPAAVAHRIRQESAA